MLNETTLKAFIGERPLRFYPQVDSTQDIALDWLREGAPTGAAIIADEQVKGRGRHGRIWHTPPGVGLALSVILRPRLAALPQVTMLGAVAIAEMIEALIPDEKGRVTVKWPNDVKVDGHKVCGILPEALWHGDRLLGVALGIGVNVRVDFTGTTLESTAISLEPALNRPFQRAELVASLLGRIDQWERLLGSQALFSAWQARLETLNRAVEINDIKGIAERVDEHGALYVRDAHGMVHKMFAGDVNG